MQSPVSQISVGVAQGEPAPLRSGGSAHETVGWAYEMQLFRIQISAEVLSTDKDVSQVQVATRGMRSSRGNHMINVSRSFRL